MTLRLNVLRKQRTQKDKHFFKVPPHLELLDMRAGRTRSPRHWSGNLYDDRAAGEQTFLTRKDYSVYLPHGE